MDIAQVLIESAVDAVMKTPSTRTIVLAGAAVAVGGLGLYEARRRGVFGAPAAEVSQAKVPDTIIVREKRQEAPTPPMCEVLRLRPEDEVPPSEGRSEG